MRVCIQIIVSEILEYLAMLFLFLSHLIATIQSIILRSFDQYLFVLLQGFSHIVPCFTVILLILIFIPLFYLLYRLW